MDAIIDLAVRIRSTECALLLQRECVMSTTCINIYDSNNSESLSEFSETKAISSYISSRLGISTSLDVVSVRDATMMSNIQRGYEFCFAHT